MATLIKRNLCDQNGNILLEDISYGAVFPNSVKLDVMVEFIEHGVMEGYSWIEEHHVTGWPWLITLLFFWAIKPKVVKTVFVYLKSGDKFVDFDFPLDTTIDLKQNIQSLPDNKKFGIRDVWITTTEVIN